LQSPAATPAAAGMGAADMGAVDMGAVDMGAAGACISAPDMPLHISMPLAAAAIFPRRM